MIFIENTRRKRERDSKVQIDTNKGVSRYKRWKVIYFSVAFDVSIMVYVWRMGVLPLEGRGIRQWEVTCLLYGIALHRSSWLGRSNWTIACQEDVWKKALLVHIKIISQLLFVSMQEHTILPGKHKELWDCLIRSNLNLDAFCIKYVEIWH